MQEMYKIIEASAGTGKTQALAEQLINLIKANVKPEEIVALTFSRAAAGEIFERFVTLLAKRGEAELLRKVIASQHLSQIGTLDSFLMRIVRAFPLELGLGGELELMDDYHAHAELNRIVFSILRRTDRAAAGKFVNAFRLAMNQDDVRSFIESYRDFVNSWHEKVTDYPDASAWGDAKTIWGEESPFTKVTEKELNEAADGLLGLQEGDAWLEFVNWVRNFRGKLSPITGIASKIVGSDEVLKHAAFEIKFNRKPYKFLGEAAVKVQTALMCVYGYVIRQRLELARGIYALVNAYEQEYDKRVRSEGRLVFADIPRLIDKLDEDKRLALEYRLDSRLRAWALDEFQDTSREQWRALSPLIEEAKQSDGEKSVFIVGDRKQAIYGWRAGDVKIFEHELECSVYKSGVLDESWRYGPAVTEAVNRVFTGGKIKSEFRAFESPEHKTAKPELDGFVQTIESDGGKMKDFVTPIFNALKAVSPISRNLSTAILVRSNKFGEFLAAELKRLGLEGVIWEGESRILDTPALSAFLDLVQLADHPGDMLTYRHFLMTPLAKAKYPDGAPEAKVISEEFARAFTERGLSRTFRELRSLFPNDPNEAWNVATEARFTELIRAAAEFELDKRPDSRLADFPDYLAARTKRNLAEPGRIRIMTIHHSKGLGFDYVLLPLYEHQAINSDVKGPLIGDGWVLPDPGANVAKAIGGLEDAYNLRKNRAELEALCIYYVAMTRAKRALTIVLHPAPKTSTGTRFSDIVRASLPAEIGNREWYLKVEGQRAEVEGSKFKVEGSKLKVEDKLVRGKRIKLQRRLPSKKYVSGQSAAQLFYPTSPRKQALERGIAVHAELEKIDFNDWILKPEGFTEIWKERPFELLIDGVWTSGRFDRVLFLEGAAGATNAPRAIIQDFKTGRHIDPEVYRTQLTAYRRALSVLTNIPETEIAIELLLVDQRKVVRL